MDLTFVELFAGVGGLSRGLEMAGWQCKGHAEWDAHPRAVLRKQWPEVPLWGDVSKLSGHDIVQEVGPFTMLTFGAPCQDFSIAGKRSGMEGERSVLVLDALRIWEESEAPLALYENVVGMLSSNNGADFAGILAAFVGSNVAVPARGWRGGGGVVRGRRGVAAWRVLDAQYFGVPQRRRRVFVLGTRTGGIDPAQVLSLLESVSGDTPPRRKARQGAPADVGAGASLTFDARGNGDGQTVNTMAGDHQNRVTDYTAIILRNREGKPGGGKGPLLSEGKRLTLGTSNDQVVFTMASGQANAEISVDIAPSLTLLHEAPIAFPPGIPRRLIPVECERLMGWPDGWTAEGIDEDGERYALSDTARYKACGNGVASPVAAWIGFQLKAALCPA
jgi:DNA (cytosine-5)-methyltransferase 1